MSEIQNTKQYFVVIYQEEEKDNKTVAVTKEVYQAYKRPLWRERKRRVREARCRMSGQCAGNCNRCDNPQPRKALSLEQLIETGAVPSDHFSLEDYLIECELYQALYTSLDMLKEEDRLIAVLYSLGISERKIAAKVGLSQKGVNYRKNIIFEELRKLLKDFV